MKFLPKSFSHLPTLSILLLRLFNSPMMKFLIAITAAVKLDMDFILLSKLRSTFEKFSLVSVLHFLFLVLCQKVPHHFQIRFDCHRMSRMCSLLRSLSKIFLLTRFLVFHRCNLHLCLMPIC